MTALPDFLRLRIGALCCLALLTGQALTAALLPPPAARTPLFAEGLLDDRIVICTAAGLVVIDRRTGEPVAAGLPGDGRSDDGHDGEHAGAFCLFCLPILHGGTDMPAPVELPVPGARAVRCETPAAPATLPAGRPAGSAWPRGPPTPLPL
ncbi:hypothetical protein VY88_14500 [Azospirillum thiophilum]|uniref:DUF2946 domain-containing protein n=1 Tax=Azospirillum thiophilum TaxID=528244 RepID=A0AAC8ZUZ4_9PROT|nr:DUF2946 family protein [Azospirillum thiophilum]ALG73013.1 hypothetical protein AL072_19005 [Azospirillum thiophilum]KJR64070.1 hypothetical protein VY88_14500 [Azospirillum thiophilum]